MTIHLTNYRCLNCGIPVYVPRYSDDTVTLCTGCARELEEKLAAEAAAQNQPTQPESN